MRCQFRQYHGAINFRFNKDHQILIIPHYSVEYSEALAARFEHQLYARMPTLIARFAFRH